MLTPQEVAQQSFGKASFNGYNMAAVDEFLDKVTADYEALFNENALLKQKLGVLSGKIREYQSTEEAMRKTLLAAQQMADKMVKETEDECAAKLAAAELQAAATQREIARGLAGEQAKLDAARASVAQYRAKIQAVCQQELTLLEQLDALEPPQEIVPSETLEGKVEDIQAAVERSVAQEEPASASAEAPKVDDLPQTEMPMGHAGLEESSLSLYEQLMGKRLDESAPPADGEATRRYDSLKDYFGKEKTED